MSAVPFYAVNTSCRSAECPKSPLRFNKIQHEESRRRTQSLNERTPTSPPPPAPGSASATPPVARLQLPDARLRSSSLNHLQKVNQQQQTNRDRLMEVFSGFN